MTNDIVINIINFIENNINEEISINSIQKYLCYDKSYLMKIFKKETGLSIISYVNMLRIINSINMLSYDESLLKISLLNGFNSLEYFSEMFKTITGVNPTIYKKFIKGDKINEKDYLLINKFIINSNMYMSYINEYKNGLKDKKVFSLILQNKVA